MIVEWGTSKKPDIKARHLEFIGSQIPGGERGFGACVSMGMVKDGKLIGAMIWHNYSPEAGVIEFSGAGKPGWLTRSVLKEMFGYAYNDAGCQVTVARASEHNYRLHRILTSYGFSAYKIPRLRGRNEDEIIFTLTDDAWRANRFNKVIDHEQTRAARAA